MSFTAQVKDELARVDGPTEVTVSVDVPCTAAGIVRWPEDELEAAAEAAGSAQAVEIESVEGDVWTVDDRKIVDGNVFVRACADVGRIICSGFEPPSGCSGTRKPCIIRTDQYQL